MAHRKNPRSLRSSLWRNPVFCQYIQKKQTKPSWTKALKTRNTRTSFSTKIFLKMKKNFFAGQKKNNSILKLRRTVVYTSHYRNKKISLFSKDHSLNSAKQIRFFFFLESLCFDGPASGTVKSKTKTKEIFKNKGINKKEQNSEKIKKIFTLFLILFFFYKILKNFFILVFLEFSKKKE